MTRTGPGRRVLILGCWLPPALWAAALLYVRRYDGWGAWAAAPLFLPTLILSLLWAAAGVATLTLTIRRHGGMDFALIGATIVGGAPVAYYVLRLLARQI